MKKLKHKTKNTVGYLIEETGDGKAYVLIDDKVQTMGINIIKRWYNIVDVEIVEKGDIQYIKDKVVEEPKIEEPKVEEPKVYGKPDIVKEYSELGYKVREYLEKYKDAIKGEIKDNKRHSVIQYGGYNITEVHFRKQSIIFYFNGSCLVHDDLKECCSRLDYGWAMNMEYTIKDLKDLEVINKLMDASVFFRANQIVEKDKKNKK